jgi:hypothetical protein
VPLVEDPSNEIAEVLVEALEWNMMSREFQYFLRIGSEISFSAGNDEQGRFASANVGEIVLKITRFSFKMYMYLISCTYPMYIL